MTGYDDLDRPVLCTCNHLDRVHTDPTYPDFIVIGQCWVPFCRCSSFVPSPSETRNTRTDGLSSRGH